MRFVSNFVVTFRNPKYVTVPWMLGAPELAENRTRNHNLVSYCPASKNGSI